MYEAGLKLTAHLAKGDLELLILPASHMPHPSGMKLQLSSSSTPGLLREGFTQGFVHAKQAPS